VPSQGPFAISYPLWFWLIWFALFACVVGLVSWILYRRSQARRLASEIESFMTMLTPFGQYSRDMRVLSRQIEKIKSDDDKTMVLQKLEAEFRHYLVRELKVPAHSQTDKQILREIRKQHRKIYDQGGADLRRALSELSKANQDQSRLAAKDCEDLFHLSRLVAEKIYNLKRKAT
jgi:hypothetical protein